MLGGVVFGQGQRPHTNQYFFAADVGGRRDDFVVGCRTTIVGSVAAGPVSAIDRACYYCPISRAEIRREHRRVLGGGGRRGPD